MAEFKLPEVGEGIESGLVVSLLVKVGDSVEIDQPLLELETDKAVVEVPSTVAGVVESIAVKENEEAQVGQVILSVSSAEAEVAKPETKPEEASATKPEPKETQNSTSAVAEFKLPELGEGIDAGVVVGILVSVGDTIKVDQAVIELETDKAVVEVPSSVAGVVQEIHVKQNDEASVGQLILTLGTTETTTPAAPVAKVTEAKSEPATTTAAVASTAVQSSEIDSRLIPAAPSVRRLARELGVNLAQVVGSGTLGRISAEDVRNVASGKTPAATPAQSSASQSSSVVDSTPSIPAVTLPDFGKWGEVERLPMSGIRKATVRAMTQAWASVPMVTQFDKADSTDFEALRQRYKAKAKEVGASLTPTAMLLKVMAAALKKFPDFNASIDTESNEVIYKSFINIGVAVDTPNGLLVPVIKNADQKGIISLAKELGELAAKARDRKLSPDDMQGGNFNISNLGGIGGTGFTPIVNPPQVAILGVSKGVIEPVWNADKSEFVPRLMMPLALSYDHRLIDGAAAARFLRWVCEVIEDPFLIALEG